MSMRRETTEYLLDQCRAYPALKPQDLLKGLHQSVFGCGHFVTDEVRGLELLRQELSCPGARGNIEPLDGGYCRVHLGYLKEAGLAPETLLRLFVLSAETSAGDRAALEEKLAVLLELAREEKLPWPWKEVAAAVEAWRDEGFPSCHHSEPFRKAYRPAYRVIRRELAELLPLLAAVDRKRAEKDTVLAAIEGGSGSGKTTLASLLERIYDCNVFHMDDFFLRPEQRTEQRLAEPGGNVDRERFYEEVLRPLAGGQTVRYQRYDCCTQKLLPPVSVTPKALSIVEGAYSMHPELADRYDVSVFLRVSPELQCARVLRRNGPELAERFFSVWIPMEQRYFEKTDAAVRCGLILEAEACTFFH